MILPPAMQSHLAANRDNIVPRWLLWVSAKNRSTGAIETTGLWNGHDDQDFTIDGEVRTYFCAGGLINIGAITYQTGTRIEKQSATVGPITPEVEQLLRTYEPKHAPAELHLALFHHDTHALIGIGRAFKGWIDGAPISESELSDGTSATVCQLTLASSSRQGTRTLPLKKSDSAMQERSGDRGFRYADTSGSVPVWWGKERHE